MPFNDKLQQEILTYVTRDLPTDQWYEINFFPFVENELLRNRLLVEFKNARIIYKIFEGLQAKNELLLAQVKTQVIMYVSIQEAVINYVLFEKYNTNSEITKLLNQYRLVAVDVPTKQKAILKEHFEHNGKDLHIHYRELKTIDRTKIRFDSKVQTCFKLGLISEKLKEDLIQLYEYRNTIHIEAELKKGFDYDLNMSLLAYRRVEGLSIELTDVL